jgi:hypothetical protein
VLLREGPLTLVSREFKESSSSLFGDCGIISAEERSLLLLLTKAK